MPDRYERVGKGLAVPVADVRGQDLRSGGGGPGERPVGERHAGLTDEGDTKAGDVVRARRILARHGWISGDGGGDGSPPPIGPDQATSLAADRYSPRIHVLTRLMVSPSASTARSRSKNRRSPPAPKERAGKVTKASPSWPRQIEKPTSLVPARGPSSKTTSASHRSRSGPLSRVVNCTRMVISTSVCTRSWPGCLWPRRSG